MANGGISNALHSLLRKLVIGTLRRVNPGVISLRHHHTGEKFKLHSFLHKGYWYHGKRREKESMELFARLVRPGDTVIEVGGHIGYITLYFASLVKSEGTVVVFEPGPNNLPYIRENTRGRSNIHLVEKAAADFCGTASFYIESYSGQNNSLLPNYGMFDENLRSAGLESRVQRSMVNVECVTLDDFLAGGKWQTPSLIKIDVEGAELTVLGGMHETLRAENVVLMVEVTENAHLIWDRLTAAGFRAFTTTRSPIDGWERLRGDSFWVKEGDVRYALFREGARSA